MSDAPKTVTVSMHELEALLARAEQRIARARRCRTRGSRWEWESALALVCRHSLAQTAEIERLREYVAALRAIYKIRTIQYRAALQGMVHDTKREAEFIAAANEVERTEKALAKESS